MARKRIVGMRAELPSGIYFEALLPFPMNRADRKVAAAELKEMARILLDPHERLAPMKPSELLDIISDLVCDDDETDDVDEPDDG